MNSRQMTALHWCVVTCQTLQLKHYKRATCISAAAVSAWILFFVGIITGVWKRTDRQQCLTLLCYRAGKNQRKMCNFNVDFSKIFSGHSPRPHTLKELRRPSQTSPPSVLQRFAPPGLARDLRSLHRRVPPLIKILATHVHVNSLCYTLLHLQCFDAVGWVAWRASGL